MSSGTFGTNWLDLSSTSNRYTRTYIQGFMDISGGNLIVRNNNLYLTQGDASINGNLYIAKNVGFGVSGSFGVYDVCNNAQMVVDISGGVNLRGPLMGGLTLPDQSVLMTATPPLDLSNNFGTVWKQAATETDRYWNSVSVSANGQYQTAVVNDANDEGFIFTSNNYGVTWKQATSDALRYWNSVSVSANGQYQTAVVSGGYVYTSNNYGVTWTQATSDATRAWRCVKLSATGQYQTAAVNSDYIYTSNDYGITWRQATSDAGRYWTSVSMSANGQYQTAVVNSGYIYTSNDYGVTWTAVTSAGSRIWFSVSISSSGQYQSAAVGNGGYLYTSNNYGVTWTQATSDATRAWNSICISATGQYQTAVVWSGYVYTSNNYGVTWKQATSDSTRRWYAVNMSANGQYQTGVLYGGYIYTSVTPYNDLVAQNSLISYCDASFNSRLFVGSHASFGGNTTISDSINIANASFLGGNTPNTIITSYNKQGFYTGWNHNSGQGEVDFVNCKGLGVGGYYFYSIATGSSLSSNTPICYIYGNGQVSATAFNPTSDYRIKSDIQILDGSYNVDCLNPVTYINKSLNKRDIGFIAHEIQEHYPFLVSGDKDDEKLQTLNYLGIIGILTKEIQDLKARLRIVESKL